MIIEMECKKKNLGHIVPAYIICKTIIIPHPHLRNTILLYQQLEVTIQPEMNERKESFCVFQCHLTEPQEMDSKRLTVHVTKASTPSCCTEEGNSQAEGANLVSLATSRQLGKDLGLF